MKYIKWFIFEFLGKVFIEFVWLGASVFGGAYVIGAALGIPQADMINILGTYRIWIILIVFNAACLRIVLAYGLNWLDEMISRDQAERAAMLAQINMGLRLAFHQLIGRPIDNPDDPE